ncbi:uncharacterized protein JCM6883_001206 [Sporobolomyces salmoneus]|uniref:uncharacterized protein n=1 Tax=Sporobolomyces salmoneus TaxID=183962 RepID=UPI00316E8F6F
MERTASGLAPSASTSTLPRNQSTNTNLPQPTSLTSSRLTRPLTASTTKQGTLSRRDITSGAGGGARRVSQPNNRSLAGSTSGETGETTVKKPRRILQSVQENVQSSTSGNIDAGAAAGSKPVATRSIRPPSAQSHSTSSSLQAPSRSAQTTTATPLQRSQLSRSTSSRTGLNVSETPATIRAKERRVPTTTKPNLDSTGSARASPRTLSTARRLVSSSSARGGRPSQTDAVDSPRKGKERVPSSSSSSTRKPSLSSNTSLDQSTSLRRSTTNGSIKRESPLKRSTTISRLPNPASSTSLMRPPTSTTTAVSRPPARRIPLPSSSGSSSSIPIFSSSSSNATASTSTSEPRTQSKNRIGLGQPPIGGARRVSVANARLGGGGATSRPLSASRSGTPRRGSTLRNQDRTLEENEDENRRTSHNRRESWETVGSNHDRTRSRSTSTTSTISTTQRLPSSTLDDSLSERQNPFSTPSKSLSSSSVNTSLSASTATPRFNAVLLSPPRTDASTATSGSHPTLPIENRQLSLLRSSTSSTPGPTGKTPRRRQPRGSTTLEELLQNGLFSSPSFATPGATKSGGGGGGTANDFEFLMDEEVSRVMMEEINSSGGGGGTGTPWRGRVVSLSMSASGNGTTPTRAAAGGGGDLSFEMDPREETDGREGVEGAEMSREILVLQRVDEEELEELRKEKEALSRQLEDVKKEQEEAVAQTQRETSERFESEMEEKRKEWELEKREFETAISILESTKGSRLDLALLEATTAYKASQTGYEHVVNAAVRERDELFGALEGLKIIAKGLEAWESVC